ncbi:MAG: hypothetical protein ACK5VI_09980 [Opitutia bacterium]
MADFTTFKRGMSFHGEVVWTPTPTEPANLIGFTVTSAILDADRKRHELTVTNPSGDGINYVAQLTDTSDWAVGDAYWDFKITGTEYNYSTTWTFNIIPQVTL